MRRDELKHYGIPGQKWGVRRFQNPDGTLTEEGKRRYLSDRGYERLKRAIRKERAKQYGGSNRWIHSNEIGEHGKEARKLSDTKRRQYENSPEFKAWTKKYDAAITAAERKVDTGKMSMEEYDALHARLFAQRPKKNFEDVSSWAKVVGKGYVDNYINRGGKTLTIARLQDLGFDIKSAEQIANNLAKRGKTLATI